MLTVKNLSAALAGTKILDNISISANPGEIIGLLGPNGSGKSTLIKTLLGLVKKQSGEICCDGKNIERLSRKAIARLFSYVPQNASQNSLYTVLECVVMGRYPHLVPFERYGARDLAIASAALARVGLEGFENRIISTLSGGEAARTACARAITQDAPVMMLDEPTSALDPNHAIALMSLIRELADEGRVIILSLHDINLAINYADRLIFLKKGRIFGELLPSSVDRTILEGLYGITWEILKTEKGDRVVAIPAYDA